MSAGKGDKPRPCNKDRFNRNYEGIDFTKKPTPSEPKHHQRNQTPPATD